MAKKTYRPKKDYEGARLTLSMPDSPEALVVEQWPYETESPTEQAALDSHPWITDRPDTSSAAGSDQVQVNATDGARDLAKAEGVDLAEVEGTGQNGRITKEDVKRHLAGPKEEE